MNYLNFDLLILRTAVGYATKVTQSPAGETRGTFNLPFREEEVARFSSLSAREFHPQGFGAKLYRAVFTGGVETCLLSSLDNAEAQNCGLRIRLFLDKEEAALAALPWEYLYSPERRIFLALHPRIALVRYLKLAQSPPALTLSASPLRILAVIANPQDTAQLAVEQEWEYLQKAIATLRAAEVQLECLPHATWSTAWQRLQQGDVHLLHFIGHGDFDLQQQQGVLVFENDQHNADHIPADKLAVALQKGKVRLVVLNACQGAASDGSDYFTGAAQSLVSLGVPVVMAMQLPIRDSAAIALAKTFYGALTQGKPIDAALTEARRALYLDLKEEEAWGAPVLFSRSDDYRLFELLHQRCPYRDLKYFEPEHADIYFGRAAMVQKLLTKLKSNNFVVLIGASGSGKSSLVRAGLIPAVQGKDAWENGIVWQWHVVRAGTAVKQGAVALVEQVQYKAGATNGLLLLVDQLEELFTLCGDESMRQDFLATLLQMADTEHIKVICTLRADFYDRMLTNKALSQRLEDGLVNMRPLELPERRAVIEQPVLKSACQFEAGLVDRILADTTGDPGELPLLEFALTQLWKKQVKDTLTHAAYTEIKGVRGAIAQHAEDKYNEFSPLKQAQMRRVLIQMVQPIGTTGGTRRRVLRKELNKDDWLLVNQLANDTHRLIIIDKPRGEQGEQPIANEWAELAHEALIDHWPSLQKWLEAAYEFRAWQERLREAIRQWEKTQPDEGALLRGKLLAEAEGWLEKPDTELSPAQTKFIEQSKALRERLNKEQSEKVEQARQLAAEQKQRAYQRQTLLGAIGTGIGYAAAISYLYIAAQIGPLLTRPLPADEWPVAITLLFNGLPLGALLGVSIGLTLWRWRNVAPAFKLDESIRKLLIVGCGGALTGSLSYLGTAIAITNITTVALIFRFLWVGALLGGGLGASSGFFNKPSHRFSAMFTVTLFTATLAHLSARFGVDWLSAFLAGAILGGCAGIGFYLGGVQEETKHRI